MELEELDRRLAWLEKERSKDKDIISALEARLAGFESDSAISKERFKEIDSQLARTSSATGRLDQFDKMIAQYRTEVNNSIEEAQKKREKLESQHDKRRKTEIDGLNKSMVEVHKALETLTDMRKNMQARIEEEARLGREIKELGNRFKDVERTYEDEKRIQRAGEESRKQDARRIADMQGEFVSIRKRLDEAREKVDINADVIKHLDTRINELLSSEADRRQEQLTFIERQSLAQVDRDRVWKEWQNRLEVVNKQIASFEENLLAIEDLKRSAKRAQDSFEEINQRLERRIKEITEIQRLAEERFRQEWVSFKSDDQKRWTNFNLAQESNTKELRAGLSKFTTRASETEDELQTLQDQLQQTSEVTSQQMQELMNWAHEWMTNYERIMGRSSPAK